MSPISASWIWVRSSSRAWTSTQCIRAVSPISASAAAIRVRRTWLAWSSTNDRSGSVRVGAMAVMLTSVAIRSVADYPIEHLLVEIPASLCPACMPAAPSRIGHAGPLPSLRPAATRHEGYAGVLVRLGGLGDVGQAATIVEMVTLAKLVPAVDATDAWPHRHQLMFRT
jgi:hypothetical protein